MKKKGFTLIELLAIVIILGIVAVIATPIIIDIIGDARRKANYVTAVNLIKAADNYYAESLIDPVKRINIRNISNIYNDVDVQGKRPAEGELYVNNAFAMQNARLLCRLHRLVPIRAAAF